MRISSSLLFIALFALRCFALPLSFEKRDATHFLARFSNSTVELRPDGIMLRDVTLHFVGAAPSSRMEGLGTSAPTTYLRAGMARTFLQFPKLAIHGLYPGVDAIFYGSGENLEYDLQLSSGNALDRIRISVEGTRDFQIDSLGNLTIRTSSGVLQQMRPRVFQRGHEISARYVLFSATEVGVKLGKHDRHLPLTIDPVLTYTKSFGGSGSSLVNLLATDAQGNIYAAGTTSAVDFPTTSNSFEPSAAPSLRVLSNGGQIINPLRIGPAMSVGAVGATPDGKVLYAATSGGILLSGDSGATWRQTAPLPIRTTANSAQFGSVNAFSIDSFDPATILVATTAGLFGTDSGGQFWGERDTGLNVSASGFASVVSVFYDPTNPYNAYAVTSGPSYVFASSDAGNTWRRLEPTYPGETPAPTFSFSPNLAATLSSDGKILYVINGNGTLLKSPDGGASWVPLAQGFFSPASLQLDPSNGSTLYVVDYKGLHKSTDGGLSFAQAASGIDVRTLAVDSTGAVYVGTQASMIFVSTDGAKTFAPVPNLSILSGATLSVSGNKVYVGSFTVTVGFVVKLDPTGTNILYSTFLGGSSFGDSINGLAVDSQGNAVLVGTMNSPDFPLTVPTANPPGPGKSDGFLTKLSSDGTRLIYSTAVAASKPLTVQGVALDSSGAVFITGQSYGDIATTPNAVQPAAPSTACTRPPVSVFGPPIPVGNTYISKIGADGKTPVYTTLLTGSCGSYGAGITTDPAGDAIVYGFTPSPDFPASANSYQSTFPGPITTTTPPAILNAGFVAKLSPAGDKILASTFLGGGYSTQANAVVLDAAGNAYVTGFTQGFGTGATQGAYQTKLVDTCSVPLSIGPSPPYAGTGDAFILKLDGSFTTAGFLTYLGGGCSDVGNNIALDPAGNIWLSGTTSSPDFPLKTPFQASYLTGSRIPGFVSELSADGSQLLFSSFSEGEALALGSASVYLGGSTGTSAFVAKIDPAKSPAIGIDSISLMGEFPPSVIGPFFTGVAPGQLIQINGHNLGPATKVSGQLDVSGRLPFVLANTVVFFDNISAPLLSADATSILCFVPFEVVSATTITVNSGGQVSNGVKIGVVSSALQVLNIVNQDGSANSADHPAKAGSVITLYLSGLGETNPPGADGLVNTSPLPVPLTAVTVYFPTTPSAIAPQFVGGAPGMIAGITQVNVQVPATIPTSGSANPLAISVNLASGRLYTTQ